MSVNIERDRRLREQFIYGISDDKMMREIIKELTTSMKTNEIISDLVLSSTKE